MATSVHSVITRRMMTAGTQALRDALGLGHEQALSVLDTAAIKVYRAMADASEPIGSGQGVTTER